jgi:lysozyme family protein
MNQKFERVLPLVLAHEGGYVNHPEDPGGATNRGVTQVTYDAWRRSKGQAPRDVRRITDDEVTAIYRTQYWDTIRGDSLPPGVAYCVFDAAVNSGPARAVRWLQEVAGVVVDGIVGVRTLAAVEAMPPEELIGAYCDTRMAFLWGLRHWPTFGRGWTRRVEGVRAQALAFVLNLQPAARPLEPVAKGEGEQAPDGSSAEDRLADLERRVTLLEARA